MYKEKSLDRKEKEEDKKLTKYLTWTKGRLLKNN